MNLEKIVLDVFASGSGQAHSEDMLFIEVINQHKELIDRSNDIRAAISSLINKGFIVHDKQMPNWIKLEKNKL